MNKIIIEEDKEIYLDQQVSKYTYEVRNNAKLKIFNYSVNKSYDVEIYLKGENSSCEYIYSTINKDDNYFNIKVVHEGNNTVSRVVNHGVNLYDNKLCFKVDGVVKKDTVGCQCSQDNKIMNLENGKSTIEPNLIIDSFDCESNHAAYIGNFKEEVLFYLKSRGISQSVATKMLTRGFLVHSDPNKEKIEDFLKEIESV